MTKRCKNTIGGFIYYLQETTWKSIPLDRLKLLKKTYTREIRLVLTYRELTAIWQYQGIKEYSFHIHIHIWGWSETWNFGDPDGHSRLYKVVFI